MELAIAAELETAAELATEAELAAETAEGLEATASETAALEAIQARGAHLVEVNLALGLSLPAIEVFPVRAAAAVEVPGQVAVADLVAAADLEAAVADGGGRGRCTGHDEAKGFHG